MKYPWIRNEISTDISLNNRGYANYWVMQSRKTGGANKSYLTYDYANSHNIRQVLQARDRSLAPRI